MNVVAMNNVGQAKMLSLVPVLDAMPQATEMAARETAQWEQILDDQLRRGVPGLSGAGDIVRTGLSNLRQRMAEQRDILVPVAEALNDRGLDIRRTTYWRIDDQGGAAPHGALWQSAMAMREVSEAVVDSAGVLAQSDAARFGRAHRVETAFCAPLVPEIPAEPGRFDHFRYVLRGQQRVLDSSADARPTGGAGGAIPDLAFPHRLGPYARLHRWRNPLRTPTDWAWVPGTPGTGQTRGGGGVNVGGRRSGGSARGGGGGSHAGRWAPVAWETIGYTTYGPYSWAMRNLDWYANDQSGWGDWSGRGYWYHAGALDDTFFYRYIRDLSGRKLEYLFAPRPVALTTYHDPNWVWSYPEAKSAAARVDVDIEQTLVYLVEIASRSPRGSGSWLAPGRHRANKDRPIAIWIDNWSDPAEWESGGQRLPQVGAYIWRDEYTYETTQDAELGIDAVIDPNTGQPVWQTVYMTAYYIFGGVDIGTDFVVSNPANYQADEILPRPMLLDTGEGDYDPTAPDPDAGIRRESFSFLGVARDGQRSAVWPQRFRGINPSGAVTALAQAQLLNHRSWDLWTQDWQVRLAPVTDWEDWADRMDYQLDRTGEIEHVVDPPAIEETIEYLMLFTPEVTELMTNH
jgi:hypothetical protein